MPELTNKDVIRMHLEMFIQMCPDQSWSSLLAYCTGYYEHITLDIIEVVRDLWEEGLVK